MSVRPAARERTSSCDSTSSDCMPNICGVCWNKYNEGRRIPKSLVCGHTICHTCVNGLISHTAKITCPLCRKETRTRLGDIPTNYQLLQLLQKMGLLCKDPESRPASPGQNHEDLLAIEDELRGSFTGALSHFSSIVDEVTKSINDLGLDPLKVMPHSRNFRTAASFGGEPPTVLDAAQKRLAALGQVYTELEKDVEAARNRQKKIEECLRNGSVSVDQNMKKLKFLRSDVAAELGPFPDHMPSRTMPYQLRTTPPPFMIDPVVDSGFGTIQFFDDIDVLRWEEQEAVFGDVSPNEEDDDEDFDDDTIYGYGWGGSAGPNSEDGYEANFSDDIDEAITNCFCYLCNCQLPHDNASRRTHVSGRRHRETKAANEPFVISFKAEAETHLSYHTHLRDFIPNLNLRIEVPDTRPFRQGRSGRGGRGGGNRAPQQRQDVHHGGPGPSGGNHRRGRGRGGGGGNRNGQRRPGYRVPQENQDVSVFYPLAAALATHFSPGHVIPNFSWQPYNDWHGAEQPGFGW